VDRVPAVRFLAFVDKYRLKVVDAETGLPFEPSRRGSPLTIERLAFETGGGLRLLLNLFLPFCGVLFGASFLWDFHGVVRSCAVAGAIGFGTNWVAIKMLFWPREPRPVFGHGLIPSQRDQLIEKVADEVLRNLINEELIVARLREMRLVQRLTTGFIDRLRELARDPEFKADLRHMILTYVGDFASHPETRSRLADRAEKGIEDFAGTRFRGWLVRRLKDVWRPTLAEAVNQEVERLDETLSEAFENLDELVERLPAALETRQEAIDHALGTMLVSLVREVDIRGIVLEQLDTITTEQLETGFREFSDDKFSYITILGGVLGLIGGTVIIWPVASLVVMVAAAALLWVVDRVAAPLMGSRYWPRQRAADR
jgi:uncharacterized membrane-anchored protein YjiN (DUF445 family)